MPAIDKALFDGASRAWQAACHKLGVTAIAPFVLEEEDRSVACLAFLPDFGGPNGMLIGAMDLPEVNTDDQLVELAEKKGLFFSFVNATPFAKTKVDEAVFKDALE